MRSPLYAVIFVLLAALITGITLWPRAPGAQSVEVLFVRQMTQHHLQAIDMATRMREKVSDPQLRALTLDIMLGQQGQVGEMRGWLTQWNLPWGGPGMNSAEGKAMGMVTPAEVAEITQLPGPQAERVFLHHMIEHHAGAVQMVEQTLKSRLRPEVRELAFQMMMAQRAEIALMNELLRVRGGWDASQSQSQGSHQHSH